MTEPVHINAKGNPLLVALRKTVRDGASYRQGGLVWLEGDHLCAAALARGAAVRQAVFSESGWRRPERRDLAQAAARVVVVPDALFADLGTLPSPADIGFVIDLPAAQPVDLRQASVVLDRLQDAGNVGSILRSAAALGVTQVLALKGTAALWSPKVLRAGMGAHFGLRLVEGLQPDDLAALQVPLVGTSLATDHLLHRATLPWPCAWVLGHEGQGVSAALLARCALQVRIPQPGGEESLNVAAAAAVCFYEAQRRI